MRQIVDGQRTGSSFTLKNVVLGIFVDRIEVWVVSYFRYSITYTDRPSNRPRQVLGLCEKFIMHKAGIIPDEVAGRCNARDYFYKICEVNTTCVL